MLRIMALIALYCSVLLPWQMSYASRDLIDSVQVRTFFSKEKESFSPNRDIHDFLGQTTVHGPVNIKLPIDYGLYPGDPYFIIDLFSESFFNKHEKSMSTWLVENDKPGARIVYIKTESNPFNIQAIIDSDVLIPEAVIWQEKNGAIYYDRQGNLKAIYTAYNKNAKQYGFAIADGGHRDNLQDITKKYSIIKTLSSGSSGELITLDTAKLTPEQFSKKIIPLYEVQPITGAIQSKLDEELQMTELLRSTSEFSLDPQLTEFDPDKTLSVYKDNIAVRKKKIIEGFKLDSEKTNWHVGYEDDHVLIMASPDGATGFLSYYFIEDNGLVYQIAYNPWSSRSDYSGTLLDHLRMINTLRQLPVIQVNHYSANLIKQHAKRYAYAREWDESDGLPAGVKQYFLEGYSDKDKGSGVIDAQGNVILAMNYHCITPSPKGYLVESEEDPVKRSGGYIYKKGFVDFNGKVVIVPKYKFIKVTDDGLKLFDFSDKETFFKY